MPKRNTIRFYRTTDKFGEFSNFAAFPIRLKDVEWPTSEHYFQAQKFAGTPHEEAVRVAASPTVAAKMGRDRRRPLRRDWESAKDDVMREAVLAKFQQHAPLLSLMLSTGDAEIVEHTKNDSYWGDGGDGSGQNMLGLILMEIRDRLRQNTPVSETPSGSNLAELSPRQREASLRRVSYVRHEFHGEPKVLTNSLLAFIYDFPYFGACGVFPPFHLLNQVLAHGGGDGGMSPGASWRPFELSRQEYDDLVAAVRSVPVESLRGKARYARLPFKFDPTFDQLLDDRVWLEAVCAKYRATWHAELRAAGFMK